MTVINNHPLVQHKISLIRDKNTDTNSFRNLIEEISMLMGYEALMDLPTEDREVETPLEKCMTPFIAGKKLAIVPVLRAGLGMVPGLTNLVPTARIGHIGMYRDPDTHEPKEYYCKLPADMADRTIFICDPMLATGGSASAAIDLIKEKGAKRIKMINIIAAPEGIKRIEADHPDIQLYIGHVDRQLNDHAYILPGLGDAGDRIFGTK